MINCLDIFMTHRLLYKVEGAVETNPIADFFIEKSTPLLSDVFSISEKVTQHTLSHFPVTGNKGSMSLNKKMQNADWRTSRH